MSHNKQRQQDNFLIFLIFNFGYLKTWTKAKRWMN
jgi:hypothetical protein